MSSRQHMPMQKLAPERPAAHSRHQDAYSALSEQEHAHAVEGMGALAVLGLARLFEWQATAAHVMLTEWVRQQQGWLGAVVGGEQAFRQVGLNRSHLERTLDVVRLWSMWGVTTEFALAHGLMSSCNPKSLGLPVNSGRRAGFDLGRRAAATVIAFPDRRRAEQPARAS